MCKCRGEELVDLSPLDGILSQYAGSKGALIPILQRAQSLYGYLPPEVLTYIADQTDTPLSQVFGVVTFYSQFYLTRRGKCIIRQCDGTACHVRGAGRIIDSVRKELGIAPGETTPDYEYTFEVVYCLGSCGLAPVAVVNEQVEGRVTPERMTQILRQAPQSA